MHLAFEQVKGPSLYLHRRHSRSLNMKRGKKRKRVVTRRSAGVGFTYRGRDRSYRQRMHIKGRSHWRNARCKKKAWESSISPTCLGDGGSFNQETPRDLVYLLSPLKGIPRPKADANWAMSVSADDGSGDFWKVRRNKVPNFS